MPRCPCLRSHPRLPHRQRRRAHHAGDLTLQQEAGDFFFRRSADVDRRQFIAGAEVRVTRRLSANVEFGTGEGRYTAVSLRYGFGRGPRMAAASTPDR